MNRLQMCIRDRICSGSMLGVNYKKIESNSVGYKKDYEMFSMDFEEFLWAKGYGNETVENLLSHMKAFIPDVYKRQRYILC